VRLLHGREVANLKAELRAKKAEMLQTMAGIPDHSFKARRGARMHPNKTGRHALAHARAQASGFAEPCPHLGRYMQFWRQHRQVSRMSATVHAG